MFACGLGRHRGETEGMVKPRHNPKVLFLLYHGYTFKDFITLQAAISLGPVRVFNPDLVAGLSFNPDPLADPVAVQCCLCCQMACATNIEGGPCVKNDKKNELMLVILFARLR